MGLTDIAWKEIIEGFFPQFIDFFIPQVRDIIDFSKKPVSREQELHNIFPDKKGEGIVDKLMEVYTKDGENPWIFIHIEIQNYKDKLFSRRMFKYFYRIMDRYEDKKIIACAILGDNNISWRSDK